MKWYTILKLVKFVDFLLVSPIDTQKGSTGKKTWVGLIMFDNGSLGNK